MCVCLCIPFTAGAKYIIMHISNTVTESSLFKIIFNFEDDYGSRSSCSDLEGPSLQHSPVRVRAWNTEHDIQL